MADNCTKYWTCKKCNCQLAISAVVYVPLITQTSPSRKAIFENIMGEVWKTALLVSGDGIAMNNPRYCPNCGEKVVEQ